MAKIDLKTVGTFVGGVLFGTAGLKILGSDDAKKVYTNCTAAGMRAKDCVMKTVSTVQENVGDIVAEAEQINEERQEYVTFTDSYYQASQRLIVPSADTTFDECKTADEVAAKLGELSSSDKIGVLQFSYFELTYKL